MHDFAAKMPVNQNVRYKSQRINVDDAGADAVDGEAGYPASQYPPTLISGQKNGKVLIEELLKERAIDQ